MEETEDDSSVFNEMETALNTNIPTLLKAILIAAGYDDALLLASINEGTNIQTISDFIDTPSGIQSVKDALGSSTLKAMDMKHLSKPSNYLQIPGNKARLKGIQDYFNGKRKESVKNTGLKTSVSVSKKARSKESRNSDAATNNKEDDLSNLQKTLKSHISKLKLSPEDRHVLEKPTINIGTVGSKKHAEITCLLCDVKSKDRKCSVYPKGCSSWIICNYTRHITRRHMIQDTNGKKSYGAMDKFVVKSSANEETVEVIQTEPDINPILTDEENEWDFETGLHFLLGEEREASTSIQTKEPSKRKRSFQSRTERTRSELDKSAEFCAEGQRQTKLTEFYSVLNEFDLIIKENDDLKEFVNYLTKKVTSLEENDDNIAIISEMPALLRALVNSHKTNKDRKKQGHRYKDDLIRNFSSFSKDLGGKQIYEFWSKNLPIPSPSTVCFDARKTSKHFDEGEFRFPELVQYLDERNLDKNIWISEDGTRCTAKIEYDEKTNQLIGLTPQLDSNGLPQVRSFEAKSAEIIREKFQSGSFSNYIYVIMAQPLVDVPAFCLCIYGTDNRFTSDQVERRWKWMVTEAQKYDLIISGFSSDGDEKLLSAMKKWTFSSTGSVLPGWEKFFFAPMDKKDPQPDEKSLTPLCIQDIVHIGAKGKTQCLKSRSDENFLPIGGYVISGSFLFILLNDGSKSDHGLCLSDLDSKDKMNFRSVQKICDIRVTDALQNVPGSKGLIVYLRMLRNVLNAFLLKDLETYQRVYLIWKSVFVLRHWRLWLQTNGYKVSKNFITRNTYECIELCAHSLVNIIRRLRMYHKPHLFLPWRMSSQACEGEFRDARSCTPTFHTAVNVTVKEFIQRHGKIERITQKSHELSKTVIVPRHHKKMKEWEERAEKLRQEDLIGDNDILKAIMEAKADALKIATDVGMVGNFNMDTAPCFISNILNNISEEQDIDEDQEMEEEEPCIDSDMPLDVAEDIILLNDNPIDNSLPSGPSDDSLFVVMEENGQQKLVKKKTYVWLLSSKKYSLSSSRLERVKAALEVLQKPNDNIEESRITVAENLSLGEWAVFNNCPLPNRLYVGRVLDFSYLSGTGRARQCSYHSIPIAEPNEGARGIGCMADWYILSLAGNGKLEKFREPHKYQNVSDYVCTIPRPEFINDAWICSNNIISAVKGILKKSCPSTKKKKSDLKSVQTGRMRFPDSDSTDDSDGDNMELTIAKKKYVSSKRAISDSDSSGGHSPIACQKANLVNARSESPRSPRGSPVPVRAFPPLERSPKEGDFVLVAFDVRNSTTYYIGKVLKGVDEDEDIEVSYLRRYSKTCDKFSLPPVPDLASVHLESVKMILPKPTLQERSSRRQRGLYRFDVSFDGLRLC